MTGINTRQVPESDTLLQTLGEAIARVRNEPTSATQAFSAMSEGLLGCQDGALVCALLRRLVATALASWTPPTAEPARFTEVAALARFHVVSYPAGLSVTAAVVREPRFPTSLSAEQPLLKSLARELCESVLQPVWKHAQGLGPFDDDGTAFLQHLPALLAAGSMEAPTTPRLPPTPRLQLRESTPVT
jgi:hypothetical protein